MSYDSEVLADSPSAYWVLDETSGGTAADSTGNFRTMSWGGSVTPTASAVMPAGSRCFDFAGSSSVANSIHRNDEGWMSPHAGASGTMTLECWFVCDSLAAINALWGKRGTTSDLEFSVSLLTDGAVNFAMFTLAGGTVASASTAAGAVVTGTVYHLVCVYDKAADYAKIFLDGVQAATTTTSGTTANGAGSLRYGVRELASPDRGFNGRTSHLSFYPTALTSTRIGVHRSAGLLGHSLTGALSIGVTLAGSLVVPHSLTGSLSLGVTAAATRLTMAQPLTGALTVGVTMAGSLSEGHSLTGALTVAVTAAATTLRVATPASRIVTGWSTTNGSTTITGGTASAADVGATVSGPGIPFGTTIVSVTP